jgi:hypothetical protein
MCDIATIIFQFLNNSAVGAAVGAFLAYFLVAATDWRRRNRRKELIPIRVRILRGIAERKLETAKTNAAMIRDNQFTSAPVMKFPAEDLRAIQRECLDTLSAVQINALDALIYWFEAIDGLFEEAQVTAKSLEKLVSANAPTTERSKVGVTLLRNFGEIERNLPMLLTLCDCYLDDNPEGILKFKYIRQ